jgi:anti-sigma factor RsiW
MSALRAVDECARYDHAIEPYIDGELDPDHAMDVEGHVRACAVCSERVALARATRMSLKRCAAQKATSALRARVCMSIAKEHAHEHAVKASLASGRDTGPNLIRLRYALALAAAAGVVFAIGLSRVRTGPVADGLPKSPISTASVEGFETMLEEMVALHARPLPPETTNPEELQRFDPLVGVPVRRPQLKPFDANFNGARVHAMRDRRAALLQYTVKGGHRVTLYVFDSRATPVQATNLSPRLVPERKPLPVYVGRLRGYSIAAAEQRGVGYALASDLNDDESTQLMLAAVNQ